MVLVWRGKQQLPKTFKLIFFPNSTECLSNDQQLLQFKFVFLIDCDEMHIKMHTFKYIFIKAFNVVFSMSYEIVLQL